MYIIIIFAITLVGVVRIAVNYSPLPVNAKQRWLRPASGVAPCFDSIDDYEQSIKHLGLTYHKRT
jgi:hypothetical protein